MRALILASAALLAACRGRCRRGQRGGQASQRNASTTISAINSSTLNHFCKD